MQNLNKNMLRDYRSMKYTQNFPQDENFKVKQT